MFKNLEPQYRWFVITLAGFTAVFGVTVPMFCMPVFFKEISNDMGLSLVQLGTVWGMSGLAGVLTTLPGGLIGDRYGTKRTLSVACILAGTAGAIRGLSGGFISLALSMLLFGFVTRTISLNIYKTAGIWFSGREVVIANGIISTGLGIGFTLGAMISDALLSPLLGGWKNVLFLYGAISIFIGLLWCLTKREPAQIEGVESAGTVPFQEGLSRILRIKEVWLLGLGQLCFAGCFLGFTGYLPLYLRSIGWVAAKADGALAACSGAGVVGAIPLSLLSRRIGSRKAILVPALLITFFGVGLLSVFDGVMVWPLVILVGFVRDGYLAVLVTMIMEMEGVGATYAGTAFGLIWTFGALGNFITPPLGNSLASIDPGFPFIFWGSLVIVPLLTLRFVRGSRETTL